VSQTFNVIKTDRIDQLYLTALLNSRIVKGWLRHKGKMQGGNYQIDSEPLLAIPLHIPPKAEQTAIASLVKRIIEALREQSQARTNSEMEKYARLARQWDNDIQSRVQRLYGISDDEIKILDSEAPEVTQQ